MIVGWDAVSTDAHGRVCLVLSSSYLVQKLSAYKTKLHVWVPDWVSMEACMKFSEARRLCHQPALTDAILVLQTSVEDLQGAEETERRAKEKAIKTAAAEAAAEKRKATQAGVERMKDWDDEEVRMLEKALEKFPQVGVPLSSCASKWSNITSMHMRTCACSFVSFSSYSGTEALQAENEVSTKIGNKV